MNTKWRRCMKYESFFGNKYIGWAWKMSGEVCSARGSQVSVGQSREELHWRACQDDVVASSKTIFVLLRSSPHTHFVFPSVFPPISSVEVTCSCAETQGTTVRAESKYD